MKIMTGTDGKSVLKISRKELNKIVSQFISDKRPRDFDWKEKILSRVKQFPQQLGRAVLYDKSGPDFDFMVEVIIKDGEKYLIKYKVSEDGKQVTLRVEDKEHGRGDPAIFKRISDFFSSFRPVPSAEKTVPTAPDIM